MKTLLLAAICVSTCLANTTVVPSSVAGDECFGDDGSCFYYESREKLTWNEAEEACGNSGGHLASLTSKEETLNFLSWSKELLFAEDRAWIGLQSVGLDGPFQWVDGRLVDYTNWMKPQTVYGQRVCVLVTRNGTWDAAECQERHVAICRKSKATSATMTTPTTTPSPNTTTPFQGYCPEGSFTYGVEDEKCYQIFGSKLTWPDADKACRKNGQDLVTVHNIKEQEFLTAFLGKMNTSVWIGLKKSPEDEMYQWSDNSEFDFSNWAPRQPSDQQLCVEMLANPKQAGKWNDRSCDQKQGYICQTNRDPSINTTVAPSGECVIGNTTFYGYMGSCYRVFFGELSTWSEAQETCQSFNGSLTSITNAKELAFLSLLRRYHDSELWIGLSAVNKTPGLFEWEDKWPVLVSEWERDEPFLIANSNRSCVVLTEENKWTVRMCDDVNDFICKVTEMPPPYVPEPEGKCPDPAKTRVEWTNIGNAYCYYINHESLRSWGEASKLCTGLYSGARLASFHSMEELEALKKITKNKEKYWIGLAQGRNGFQWSDESPVNFVSWKNISEARNKSIPNCVALEGQNTKWDNFRCDGSYGFICMINKEVETTSTETTTVTDHPRICGTTYSGWEYFDDNCYKVYTDWERKFNWDSAQKFCQGEKSELASIHSEEENAFVYKQIKDKTNLLSDDQYWVGMFRPQLSQSFYWSDLSIVDFTNVPETGRKEEKQCVSIDKKTGSWNQTACTNQNGLVCKHPFNQPTTTTPTPPPKPYEGSCDMGWTRIGNKCVKIFDDEPLNWTMARDTCRQYYNDLFAIHNQHEEMVITSLLENYNRSLWIGLKRIMKEQFEWSDESDMDFAYWGAGEPSGIQEMCVSMETSKVRAGKWRNSMCSDKRGYICQGFPSKTVTTITPEYDNMTKEGFVKYGSADYKFELNVTKARNWEEAEEACKMFGGHMASINSPYEQAFIYTQLDSVTDDDIDGLWIGLGDLGENGIFRWTDDWPIFFTDWAKGEPRHPSHNTRCVYLDLKTEEWRSADCDQPRAYICKVTDERPPPIPHVNNGTCPQDLSNWTDVGTDYCYYISASAAKDQKLTWSEASLFCQEKFASLASLHSHTELDLLVPYFKDATSAAWIGMQRKYESGFNWDDSTAVNFVHWGEGYPTDSREKDCVSMSQYNIGWQNDVCDTKLGFICKVEKEFVKPTTEFTNTTTSNTTEITTVTTTESSATNGTVTGTTSNSTVTTEDVPEKQSTGLGAGGIAGIVIGVCVAIALVSAAAYFYMRRRRSEEELLINDHSSP